MSRLLISLSVLGVLVSGFCYAEDMGSSEDKIGRGIRVIRDFCGTGLSRSNQQQYLGKVEGGISLKKLPGVTGEGSIQYTQSEAEGLAGALQKELTESQLKLTENQIECMKPFITRILDTILGPVQPAPQGKVLANFIPPNKERYCIRLKNVTDSAKNRFQEIIGESAPGMLQGQYKAKVILPNMKWCFLNTLPGNAFTKPSLYYSCSVFYGEKVKKNAEMKFSAYTQLTEECLGKEWLRDERELDSLDGSEASFQRESTDPTINIRTHEDKDGIDMGIYVSLP